MSKLMLKDSSQLEMAKELLKNAGIEFEEITVGAFKEFCLDEAYHRLINIEDVEGYEIPEHLRDEIELNIAYRWDESPILDYDYMDNIVREEVEEMLGLTKDMETTVDYFGLSAEELLKVHNESGYTREECLILDDGLRVYFFNNLGSYKEVKDDYIKGESKLELKKALFMVDGRIAMIFY